MKELREGRHIRCKEYTGTVYWVNKDGTVATIKRDDGVIGGGVKIPGYGNGWWIQRVRGAWKNGGSDPLEEDKAYYGRVMSRIMEKIIEQCKIQ